MAKNNQTWVSPNSGNGWKVQHPNSQRASGIFVTKKEAITYGREVSKNQKTEFIIQNKNGQIGLKDSYGNDHFPPQG